MSVRNEITQTMSVEWGCDICGAAAGAMVLYQTRTAVNRYDNGDALVNTWVETRWDVCGTCSKHVDNGERAALLERATDPQADRTAHNPVEAALILDALLTPLSRQKEEPTLEQI